MKKLLVLIILTYAHNTLAQDSLRQTFIEERYKGGIDAFNKDISSELSYTESAKENNYYTTAIVFLRINKEGELEYIEVLNRLKYDLDKRIDSVFTKSKENWKASENGYSHFIAITFSLYDNYAKSIHVNYPSIISENILVTAFENGEDSIVREKVNYKLAFQKNESGYDKNMRKEYYKKSKFYLSKLVEMDPFYPEFYQNRLNIETYTKIYDYACEDIRILKSIWNIRIKKLKMDCN